MWLLWMQVEKTHVKRKLEESQECDRLSESELDEGTDSDAESAASSSDSDASESEEEMSWRANKRRRAWEEVHESRRGRAQSQAEAINCDDELREMQVLLELQLKVNTLFTSWPHSYVHESFAERSFCMCLMSALVRV